MVFPIRKPRFNVSAVRRLTGLLLALGTAIATAEDWPEFRGPTGQGHSVATSLPVKWDLPANARWKVSIPGKGWSSPIVHDGRIFLTTAVPLEGDSPKRYSLRALGVDGATGRIVWDVEVFVKQIGPEETLNPKNSFASPTPITDGRHVFVHFGPDGTACLDRDGKRIWANDSLRYNSVHGAGGSPIFAGSRLVFLCDGAEDPFVAARDAFDFCGDHARLDDDQAIVGIEFEYALHAFKTDDHAAGCRHRAAHIAGAGAARGQGDAMFERNARQRDDVVV